MGCAMSALFGTSGARAPEDADEASAPCAENSTVRIQSTIELLTLKIKHLQRKVFFEAKQAVELVKVDKEKALEHMRRRKHYINTINRLAEQRTLLERQAQTLEDAAGNREVVQAMRIGLASLRRNQLDASVVETRLDDVAEAIDGVSEISQLLATSVKFETLDLEDELQMLSSESRSNDGQSMPAQPSASSLRSAIMEPEAEEHGDDFATTLAATEPKKTQSKFARRTQPTAQNSVKVPQMA